MSDSSTARVGVVVLAHGQAAFALVAAAERLVGKLEGVVPVSVETGEPCEAIDRRIAEAADSLGAGELLFLVDLFGSTPARRCGLVKERAKVVLSGVNLAMLFKLATANRTAGARTLADELAATAAKSIQIIDQGQP